jgi:membrane protein implicated in regulation of membrane protease activity
MGVVGVIGAPVIALRRWGDRRADMYGGSFAFVFHVCSIFCVGVLVLLLLTSVSTSLIFVSVIAVGAADGIVGVVARRSQRRRRPPSS